MSVFAAPSFLRVFPSRLGTVAFFFFYDTAAPEIYTLSLHDALPISPSSWRSSFRRNCAATWSRKAVPDRKSTRLNSSHRCISYAVFCLKKKKIQRGINAHYADIGRRARQTQAPTGLHGSDRHTRTAF